MNTFRKYESMENTYVERFVETALRIEAAETEPLEWIVEEKIHGANFAVYTDGHSVRFARRRGFLKKNESFFNHARAFTEDFCDRFVDAVRHRSRTGSPTETLIVYGEIYGGAYPGQDSRGIKPVQQGVFYHPDIQFAAFDVVADGVYLDYDDAAALLDAANIPRVPELRRYDRLEDALKTDESFQSTIAPRVHRLMELDDNPAEGVVIKSSRPLRTDAGERVIFKKKRANFSDRKTSAEGRCEKADGSGDESGDVLETLRSMITSARVSSARSKLGIDLVPETVGRYQKEIRNDILEEFKRHRGDKTLGGKKQRNWIVNKLSNAIRDRIQKEMVSGDAK